MRSVLTILSATNSPTHTLLFRMFRNSHPLRTSQLDLLNRLRSIGSRLRLLCRKPRLMLLRKQLTPTLHKPLSVWLVPKLFLTALLQKSCAPMSLTLTLRRHSQTPTQSPKALPPNRLCLINSPTPTVRPSRRYRVYQRQALPQSWLHSSLTILLLDRVKKTP